MDSQMDASGQDRRDRAGGLVEDLLAVEIAAARLEAAFSADPDLGRAWRGQVALSEACRSVGLEDIHLHEGDLALRPFEDRLTELEPARGGWLAQELLRVIAAPGDITGDTGAVIARCLRAGMTETEPGAAGEAPDMETLAATVVAAIADAPGPAMAAIRAAAHVRDATEAAQPSAERLVFLCTDHALRRSRSGRDAPEPAGQGADRILGQLSAQWILTPSMALTARGFRAWSPVSPRGIADLLAGLRIETGRALGMLPVLRRWRDGALGACQGKHGRSRLPDLVALVIARPILTSRVIALEIGVTDRTARNLVDEAVAAGIVAPITGRRTYRAWAAVPLAERLRRRTAQGSRGQRPATGDPVDDGTAEMPAGRPLPPAGEGAEDALAELDAAMAQADAVLAKYRSRG